MQSTSPAQEAPFEELLQRASSRLWKKAPVFSKLVFSNCEFWDTEGGMALSADCFAVVKRPFRKPTRQQLDVDADTFHLLTGAARLKMTSLDKSRLIIDLVFKKGAPAEAYTALEEGMRLSGKDRGFRDRHRMYAQSEPWLSRV